MNVNEDSDQKLKNSDLLDLLDMLASVFKGGFYAYAISTKISWAQAYNYVLGTLQNHLSVKFFKHPQYIFW